MPHQGHTMNAEMEQCNQNCLDCHRSCEQTAAYCTQMGGKHADPAHITLLLDCAQICETSADFMIRQSAQHKSVCRVCAEVCRACAKSCEALGNDEMMKKCADMCRQCAESCAQMAGAA